MLPFIASAESMTRSEWEKLREHCDNPAKRHESISNCTASLIDKLGTDEISELETLYKSKGRDAVADFCADCIRSVASGETAYEDVHGDNIAD